MTAHKPSPLVPRLRFPEFHNTGSWYFQPLSDIAELIFRRVGISKCVPMSITSGFGLISQEEKFGRIIAGNSYKNYIRLQNNDFAYNKSATKEFPQGYIARYSGTRNAAVPKSIFICFRPDTSFVIPEYLDFLLHGNHHGRWLCKYITVGARAHGALSVSDDALMSMPILTPSLREQQKIADCLGSLDELIAAEDRKLEALRQHKKGLMQQLFPQPGETVPRLRFPKFRGTREWEPKKLGDIANFYKGKSLSKKNLTPDGASQCIHYGELFTAYPEVISTIYSHTDIRENLFFSVEDDVLMPTSDVTPNGLAKACCIKLNNVIIGGDILVVRTNKQNVNGEFLARYIRRLEHRVLQLASGSTIYHLYASSLGKLDLRVPIEPEQQKIADCLGSLDDLIEAEDRKLEALRQHKKGLMQQLFPNLEEK